jgi:hypothetical protein
MSEDCPAVQKQLHLFSIPNGRGNTLLDYDLIPRFLHDKGQKKVLAGSPQHQGERVIRFSNAEQYEILPALISSSKKDSSTGEPAQKKQYAVYPGTRESLIEDCLIDFAQNGEFSLEKGVPGYRVQDGNIGVCFTLHQLRESLKSLGKEYRTEELREGLEVLLLAKYRYTNKTDRDRLCGYIVSELDSIPNPHPNDRIRSDRIVFVLFDGRASARILKGHYRSYDAKCAMSMKSPIARYLYKQFTHLWQQANTKGETGCLRSVDQNETILASGCSLSSNATKKKNNMLKALKELSDKGIIEPLDPQVDSIALKEGRKITDVRFMVKPTPQFVTQQIDGYKRMQKSLHLGAIITEKETVKMVD